MTQLARIIESGDGIDAILSSVVEDVNTSNRWVAIDNSGMVIYKYLTTTEVKLDAINFYDQKKLQGLSRKNRIAIGKIEILPLRRSYRLFPGRTGLTLVIAPCASNLCIEFVQQGIKKNHCFAGTKSLVIAIGDNIEFKLLSGSSWNDFATILLC